MRASHGVVRAPNSSYVTNMNGETENAKARRDEGRKESGERLGIGSGG